MYIQVLQAYKMARPSNNTEHTHLPSPKPLSRFKTTYEVVENCSNLHSTSLASSTEDTNPKKAEKHSLNKPLPTFELDAILTMRIIIS